MLTTKIVVGMGNSMYPTIVDGQIKLCLVYFYPSNLTRYIIIFKWNEEYNIMHRVIMDNGTHVLTKGDNMLTPDGRWMPKFDIIGWIPQSADFL